MGFRFKRVIKIMPGVKVNVGKKGMSLSLGRPGASVNINRNGTRRTFGLPGTGLSHSTYRAHNNAGQPRPRPKRTRPITLFSVALVLVILFAMFGGA